MFHHGGGRKEPRQRETLDAPQGAVIFHPKPGVLSMYTPAIDNPHRERFTLRISRKDHDEMSASAEAEHPEECCGLLFSGPEGTEVVPMPNLQNQLHAENPEAYRRDARKAYNMDPLEKERLIEKKEAEGMPLAAIYHSHPEEKSYFSETDSKAAAAYGGEPTYPGVVYLIYSVIDGKVTDLKAFDWSETEERYTEVPLEIEDPGA